MEFAPNLDIIVNETIPALVELKKAGKVKHIGITGYPLSNFKNVIKKLESKGSLPIDSVLTYCRYALHDTSLEDYLPYFEAKKLDVINASPNCMGLFTNRGPPKWHPASSELRKRCVSAADYCTKQGVDISRLALQFVVANPKIPTTLFSTDSLEFLHKNLDVVCNQPTDKEKQVLKEIRKKYFDVNNNWEGMEVANYWKKIENRVAQGKKLLSQRKQSKL